MFTIDGVEYDEVFGLQNDQIVDIPIGSLITTYYSGYHVVTDIVQRKGYSSSYLSNGVLKTRYHHTAPLVKFVKVFHDDFRELKKPGKEQSCDSLYCRIVDQERIDNMITALKEETEKKIQGLETLREYTSKES